PGHMASETLLIFVLMLSSVRLGKSAETLFNVKCQSAVGVIGQTTNISCSIESQTGPVIIKAVSLTRFRENKPCFTFKPHENRVTGDSRFKVESLPSLQLHNTAISDEGGYRYYIRTNLGKAKAEFRINVTANYSLPIITSEPTEIKDGGAADLYCRASGGYPAGTIHWFDQRNTNWTQNSRLQITQGHDGLFTLSSKLSFRSIDSTWGRFRCVVLNYRYEEEEESTANLRREENAQAVNNTVKIILAAVILIGSLIVCLLIVVFFKLRVTEKIKKARSMDLPATFAAETDDVEDETDLDLVPPMPFGTLGGEVSPSLINTMLKPLLCRNRNLASASLLFVLMLTSVHFGKTAETLFNLKCQSAVGVIGQTTNISCSIESQTGPVVINTVVLTRFRENKPCFTFQPYENRVTGDSRFKVESLPSLQLHNTAISDEGGYRYYIRTNLGNDDAEFRINVTAVYSPPVITSEPTEIKDGGAADLYCRASGGYPAGTIHWFDQRNTNWTQNSRLQITQGHDGLFTLSSKLSFRSIDSTWGPFSPTPNRNHRNMPLLSLLFLVLIMSPVTKSVEAVYSLPIITSEPTEIESGGAADLYCRASGGSPAGTIHWFDQRNTNWTQNSRLQITQGHDGLFTLSSKLSFRSIDSTWGPFRCVVLNYRYEEEEGGRTPAQGRD
ncbi:muscle, skeletal receptor tyrosine-protein kinase-like isoform X1, partial [Clarias magur]